MVYLYGIKKQIQRRHMSRKTIIEFLGLDIKGKDVRLLSIAYKPKKDMYYFKIKSSIGKVLGTVKVPRELLVEPLNLLHRQKYNFFKDRDIFI